MQRRQERILRGNEKVQATCREGRGGGCPRKEATSDDEQKEKKKRQVRCMLLVDAHVVLVRRTPPLLPNASHKINIAPSSAYC